MDKDDFKKLLDEGLKPITEKLEKVEETLDDHTKMLEALAGDVHGLQDQTKAIWDKVGMGHDRNKREIDEIKSRLQMPIMPDVPQI